MLCFVTGLHDNKNSSRPSVLIFRDPWDGENLVGERTSLHLGSRDIGTWGQPLEAIGEVDVLMVESEVAQDQEEGVTSKLPGLISEAGGHVVLVHLQPFNRALEEKCQLDTRNFILTNREGPTLHVHFL